VYELRITSYELQIAALCVGDKLPHGNLSLCSP